MTTNVIKILKLIEKKFVHAKTLAEQYLIEEQDGEKINKLKSLILYAEKKEQFNYNNKINGYVDDQNVGEAYNYTRADLFDGEYYKRTYWWDIGKNRADPYSHYINYGYKEGRKPNSWFDPDFYRSVASDIDKGKDALEHFVENGVRHNIATNNSSIYSESFDIFSRILLRKSPDKIRKEIFESNVDIKKRLENGELGVQIEKLSKIEPLIKNGIVDSRSYRRPHLVDPDILRMMYLLFEMHKRINFKKIKIVLVIPWVKMGGADKVSGFVYRSLQKTYTNEEILILLTSDGKVESKHFFPEKAIFIDVSNDTIRLDQSKRDRLIFEFIRSLSPDLIVNINSGDFWRIHYNYKDGIAEHSEVGAFLFCDDINYFGDIEGYPSRYFHKLYDSLKFIATDSEYLKNELTSKFILNNIEFNKLHVIKNPVSSSYNSYKREVISESEIIRICWGGRFDYQKRLDIVFEIARRRPSWIIEVWGKPVLADLDLTNQSIPVNIEFKGIYNDITEIDLDKCQLWLYTSMWDGVPNLLLEVAALGVPIVGTNKGGGVEIINKITSEIVDDIEDVESFIQAIEKVINNKILYETKAQKLREKILNERTFEKFCEEINEII